MTEQTGKTGNATNDVSFPVLKSVQSVDSSFKGVYGAIRCSA